MDFRTNHEQLAGAIICSTEPKVGGHRIDVQRAIIGSGRYLDAGGILIRGFKGLDGVSCLGLEPFINGRGYGFVPAVAMPFDLGICMLLVQPTDKFELELSILNPAETQMVIMPIYYYRKIFSTPDRLP